MQVDIEVLRENFEKLMLLSDEDSSTMGMFDRACVLSIGSSSNGSKELTRGQRAAATRAKNRKEKAAQPAAEPAEG